MLIIDYLEINSGKKWCLLSTKARFSTIEQNSNKSQQETFFQMRASDLNNICSRNYLEEAELERYWKSNKSRFFSLQNILLQILRISPEYLQEPEALGHLPTDCSEWIQRLLYITITNELPEDHVLIRVMGMFD